MLLLDSVSSQAFVRCRCPAYEDCCRAPRQLKLCRWKPVVVAVPLFDLPRNWAAGFQIKPDVNRHGGSIHLDIHFSSTSLIHRQISHLPLGKDMTVHSSPKRTIDLLKGYPNPALLPAQAISDAASSALSNQAVATAGLSYGADEGYEPFREAIADWNSSFYSRSITKDNVVITGGASQNLACVLQVMTDPIYTRNIWISSPAYMLAFRMFQDNGFADKMQAVPEIADGIDVDWLEQALERVTQETADYPLNARVSTTNH